MARPPWVGEPAGRLDEHVLASDALRGNPLGDPAERPLWVSVPPAYDPEPARRFPTVYVLQAHGNQLEMWRNRRPWAKTYPELVDELFASGGGPPPCLVVWVDAWTAFGGSQFLDSLAVGRYHTYLCEEVVPFVDERYRTVRAAAGRALQGHSSGGYGAMVTAMLRPDLFGGFASHAGDALFEHCYARDFAEAARLLRDRYEGSFERFWDDFRGRLGISKPGDHVLVGMWSMAAVYSPDAEGGVEVPFEIATGRLLPDVWERWLAFDPVRMIPHHADALRSLHAIYLDAGKSDEVFLDLGAEAVRRALAEIGVTDVFFELFEGRHGGNAYRYPVALRYLAERLSAS